MKFIYTCFFILIFSSCSPQDPAHLNKQNLNTFSASKNQSDFIAESQFEVMGSFLLDFEMQRIKKLPELIDFLFIENNPLSVFKKESLCFQFIKWKNSNQDSGSLKLHDCFEKQGDSLISLSGSVYVEKNILDNNQTQYKFYNQSPIKGKITNKQKQHLIEVGFQYELIKSNERTVLNLGESFFTIKDRKGKESQIQLQIAYEKTNSHSLSNGLLNYETQWESGTKGPYFSLSLNQFDDSPSTHTLDSFNDNFCLLPDRNYTSRYDYKKPFGRFKGKTEIIKNNLGIITLGNSEPSKATYNFENVCKQSHYLNSLLFPLNRGLTLF